MVRMRDATAVIVIAILIAAVIPITITDSSDAAGTAVDGVLLYELQPTKENDGFALKNYGSTAVDLTGYYIKDGNGTVKTFSITIGSIDPGMVEVFVKKSKDADTFSTDVPGSRNVQVVDNKVNLDNAGDALFLYDKDDKLVDAVCYGNYTTTTGWSGEAVDLGFKEDVIRRCEPTDTNTYFDWVAVSDGYTGRSFDSTKLITTDSIDLFTFPECGGKPILQSLMKAKHSIKISIYMITSGYLAGVLKDRVDNGVTVQIMLEDKPLGYNQEDYSGYFKYIEDHANGEVKFIGGGSDDRYSYVHNKYAIVDDKEVVITSENWTSGNISTEYGNRGWGAVVRGTDFAAEMNTYFENDWNYSEDLGDFSIHYKADSGKSPASISSVRKYVDSVNYTPHTVTNAKAAIYMSPDNTYKAMQDLISKATKRVYTEQMSIGASYSKDLNAPSPLKSMIEAAERGVDARFMVAQSSAEDLVKTLNSDTKVKAALMGNSGYATMHNKGVIIDDTVWVSSVNWTDNAFMNNRECGLYIQSADAANFFADAYGVDWDKNYKATNELPVKEITIGAIILAIVAAVLLILWKMFLKKARKETRKQIRKSVKGSSKKRR